MEEERKTWGFVVSFSDPTCIDHYYKYYDTLYHLFDSKEERDEEHSRFIKTAYIWFKNYDVDMFNSYMDKDDPNLIEWIDNTFLSDSVREQLNADNLELQ